MKNIHPAEKNTTVIVTTYNQLDILPICLKWLKQVEGIKNVAIIDNGSSDGTDTWLNANASGYDVLSLAESQGLGIVWNMAVRHFVISDVIVFMEPQYFPGQKCIRRLEKLLAKNCGIAGVMSNGFLFSQYFQINTINDLPHLESIHSAEEPTGALSLDIAKGFWALSREALEKNGAFSEELVQGKNVLSDYTLRLVQNGYQPMICNQAFSYSANPQHIVNDFEYTHKAHDREILKNKWGMNYFNLIPSQFIMKLITEDYDTPLKILEVGCDLGASLLEIKNHYPNSKLYGLEINEAAVQIAKHFAEVKSGNIEDKVIPFQETFDYIIFGDVLEHLHDPQGIIRFCREKLNEHGCILAHIPNLMHISVMEQLLQGRFEYTDTGLLDCTHIHFFTRYEIEKMFYTEGYAIEQMNPSFLKSALTEKQEYLLDELMKISTNVDSDMYRAFHYTVKARKQHITT